MFAAFLVLFAALAGCQALLAVKLADWLTPAVAEDVGTDRAPVAVRLA